MIKTYEHCLYCDSRIIENVINCTQCGAPVGKFIKKKLYRNKINFQLTRFRDDLRMETVFTLIRDDGTIKTHRISGYDFIHSKSLRSANDLADIIKIKFDLSEEDIKNITSS